MFPVLPDVPRADDESFAAVLAHQLARKRVTLSQLQRRLSDRGNPVSVSTLSYWRSGARHPEGVKSAAVVDEIELILGLAPGELSGRQARVSRMRPVPASELPKSWDFSQIASDVVTHLGADAYENSRDITVHLIADVDENGRIYRTTTRTQIQAAADSMSAFIVGVGSYAPASVVPVFQGLAGCAVERVHVHHSGMMVAARFGLEAPVPRGQSTLIEYSMTFPSGYPRERLLGYASRRRMRELALSVRYPPESVPHWIEEVTAIDGQERLVDRELSGSSVHAIKAPFPVGTLTLTWGYGE